MERPSAIAKVQQSMINKRKLEERGLTTTKGFGAMWVERSEDLILEHTGEVAAEIALEKLARIKVFEANRVW